MRLVGEALSPGFASELLVESLSTALAVELRRHFDILDPEDVSREGGLSSSQVRRIRERLEEEDANNPITVAELAQREGLSVRPFSRLFRVSTGQAVSDYVAAVRIKPPKTLLAAARVLTQENDKRR